MPTTEEWYQNPGESVTIEDAEMSVNIYDYANEFLPEGMPWRWWESQYGMYFDPYDPTNEAFINESALMQQEMLMSEMLSEKGALDANTSNLGFAGSSMTLEDLDTLTSAASSKSDQIMLASQKDKYLERDDWKSSVYSMLSTLTEQEAFELPESCQCEEFEMENHLGELVTYTSCIDENGEECLP
tara:strand:+ start:1009 stop:1566 length:558 start_codon:yes stop_codon:yes gene_type:complete